MFHVHVSVIETHDPYRRHSMEDPHMKRLKYSLVRRAAAYPSGGDKIIKERGAQRHSLTPQGESVHNFYQDYNSTVIINNSTEIQVKVRMIDKVTRYLYRLYISRGI